MYYFASNIGWGPASVTLVNSIGINLIPLIALVLLVVCHEHVRKHFAAPRRRK
jgi:hypothetical protein